jgi:hypothetical protein
MVGKGVSGDFALNPYGPLLTTTAAAADTLRDALRVVSGRRTPHMIGTCTRGPPALPYPSVSHLPATCLSSLNASERVVSRYCMAGTELPTLLLPLILASICIQQLCVCACRSSLCMVAGTVCTALLEAELGAVPLLASLQPAQRREAMQRLVYTAVTAGDALRLPGRAHAATVSALSLSLSTPTFHRVVRPTNSAAR